jgi:hypothetical protein
MCFRYTCPRIKTILFLELDYASLNSGMAEIDSENCAAIFSYKKALLAKSFHSLGRGFERTAELLGGLSRLPHSCENII